MSLFRYGLCPDRNRYDRQRRLKRKLQFRSQTYSVTRANHFLDHGCLRGAFEANMVIALCVRVIGFVLAFYG